MFRLGILLLVVSLMSAAFGANSPAAAKPAYFLGLILFIPGLIRKRRQLSWNGRLFPRRRAD